MFHTSRFNLFTWSTLRRINSLYFICFHTMMSGVGNCSYIKVVSICGVSLKIHEVVDMSQ